MCAFDANSGISVWNQKFIPFPIFQGAYRIFKPKTRWIMIQWSFVIFRNLSGWKNRLSTFLDNFSDSSWKVLELIDVLTRQGRKIPHFFLEM